MSRETCQENRAVQRIPELDGLRGIAIAFVLYFHFVIGKGLTLPGPLQWFNRIIPFNSGVDLFFVLSGFLIGGILLDAKESDRYFSTFYMRRVCRILPVYWVLIGGFIAVWVVLGPDFHLFRSLTLGSVFHQPMPWYVYLSFTQNFYLGSKDSWGYFCSPCWSLAVEEQFYLTLPVLIRFLPRRWIGAVVAFLTLACITARSFLATTNMINNVQFWALPFCRADALLIGVLCALVVRNTRLRCFLSQAPVILHVLAALLGGLSLYHLLGGWPRLNGMARVSADLTLWAMFYGAILLIGVLHPASLLCKPLRFGPLMGLGTIAYALYLIHDSVRDAVTALVTMNGEPSYRVAWLSVIVGVSISVALASVSWFALEKRFIRMGRRFSYRSTPDYTGS